MKEFIESCFREASEHQEEFLKGDERHSPMLLPCQWLKSDLHFMFLDAVDAWELMEGKLGGSSMSTCIESLSGVTSLEHGRELFEAAWPIAIPMSMDNSFGMLPWVIRQAKKFRLPHQSRVCGAEAYRVFNSAGYLMQLPRPNVPLIMSCRAWSKAMVEAGFKRCGPGLISNYLTFGKREGLWKLAGASQGYDLAAEYFFNVGRFTREDALKLCFQLER
jgi:hypothetical protein